MQRALTVYRSWVVEFSCLLQMASCNFICIFKKCSKYPSSQSHSSENETITGSGASGTRSPAACSGEQLPPLWSEHWGLRSHRLAVSSRPCPCKGLESLWHRTSRRWLLFYKGDVVSNCILALSSLGLLSLSEKSLHWGSYYVGVPEHSIYALWKK